MTVEFNYTEVFNKIPDSWDKITYEDYTYLLDNLSIEVDSTDRMLENQMIAVSRLSGLDLDVVKAIPGMYLFPMTQRIEFIWTPYVPKGIDTPFQLKTIDEMSYDNFIEILQSQNPLTDLPKHICMMSKNPLTIEELNKMNMKDLQEGFFLSRKNLKKQAKHLIHSMKMNRLKNRLRKLLLLPVKDRNKSIKLEVK